MTALLEHLGSRTAAGHKLLVPYFMGGHPIGTPLAEVFEALALHSDAVEVGLPYSDPLMDGPVISAASDEVLAGGSGPLEVLDRVQQAGGNVPRVVMTYYNPIHRLGEKEFCRRAAAAGVGGLIVPDVPIEEAGDLRVAADAAGLAWIPLVAPTTSEERAAKVTATATGFVYAVSTLGVTGVRGSLSERAAEVVRRCRAGTDLPVLVGIGISTPGQAVEAARDADGVVIGSAVVGLLDSSGPAAASRFLAEVRSALDGA